MQDIDTGIYLINCPRSIFLEKQMKTVLVGKTIVGTAWEKYYTGNYSWHGDAVPGFDELSGQKIIFSDASHILTDSGKLIFISCMDGGVRFFAKGEPITLPKAVKSASHAYYATVELDDGSSLRVNLYGWGTLFKVFDVDMSKVCDKQTAKSKRYPFLPKAPIDLTDKEDFTYERFADWLGQNPAMNIIECCATAKGAFRIDNPIMNYILLVSRIHPRTKARALTRDEIRVLYENTAKLILEYQSGERICKHTDIYGNVIRPQNDVLWMTKTVLGTPCPICGTPIDAAPAAGTKMYYCPNCQVVKK